MSQEKVNWKHWLKKSEIDLADAVFLLFEIEPYGFERQPWVTQNCSEKALYQFGHPPDCPPNMDPKIYERLRGVFWAAFVACENYLHKKGVEKLPCREPRNKFLVKFPDFLKWAEEASEHNREIVIPDELACLLKKPTLNRKKKNDNSILCDAFMSLKIKDKNLTKTAAAIFLKKNDPRFKYRTIRSLTKGLQGFGKEYGWTKSGAPKKNE